MTELVAAARDRIAHIEGQITALSGELDELQTFIRVAERLAPAPVKAEPVEVQIKPEPEPVLDMATVLTVAHEQAQEPAPRPKPEPISTRPYREVSTKPITYPSGSHFRLRDVSGSYLHQSVMPGPDGNPLLTEDRTYAWQGTESQLVAVRKKLPGTIDMRVEPVIEAKPARAA